MFDFLKKTYKLVAPIDGKVVELSKVPDPVFAEKMAGDGVAIETTGDTIVSPADGKLSMIFKTNHAFGITLKNGIELLVHIGIDTVALDGKGFERIAKEGQEVKAGDPIIKINRKEILDSGYSLITPVLITNVDDVKDISANIGVEVKAGCDEILSFKIK
ncbi:PTS system IIA component, Glc family [Clostridium sp. USBA 49]|jgi:glucose-specific phosphotransferase system IIA component|uniref:PTS sugar transporter subunit IIA n=1 Tax=Clostridium sp. USBA 49 TaxID=1881060 RepID=UPI00099AFDEC|nr:PTS glucose transporter subunit IIA [Clostridium sp. USBA 49]SKA88794.1 PTS system IIA component, Glc family [Clostridium sp. USBA 49]